MQNATTAMAVFPSEVHVTAAVKVDPSRRDFLVARVALANSGRDTLRLVLESCPLTLRAYPVSAGLGPPAWRSDRAPRVCKSIRQRIALAPGAEQALTTRFTVETLLGDTLSEGRYRFTAAVRAFEPEMISPEFSAGEVEVRRVK